MTARLVLAEKIAALVAGEPDEAEWRGAHVREAAGQVLGEAVGRFVAAIEATQRDLIGQRMALRWLIQSGLAPDCAAWSVMLHKHLPDLEGQDERHESYFRYAADTDAAIAPWRDALDALMRDASAPLPA